MQFDKGQRVWHRARSMAGTYLAREDSETSYVEFDDDDTLRITTALLEPLADQEARR